MFSRDVVGEATLPLREFGDGARHARVSACLVVMARA